jgi:hypothetical protein
MANEISRRLFTTTAAGLVLGSAAGYTVAYAAAHWLEADPPSAAGGPMEAPFERDYPPPNTQPPWRHRQINRLFVQDFVIYAHFDLALVRRLLDREPALLNATMDWGAGDWETALGGASHMGRRDIAEFLLEKGARIDIFCAAMLGQLDAVRAFLTLQPKLIDAKGPHGISLRAHAQAGGPRAQPVLDYLQSIRRAELRPTPPGNAPAGSSARKSG